MSIIATMMIPNIVFIVTVLTTIPDSLRVPDWVQALDSEALALFEQGAALGAHELGPPTASA